MHDRSNIPLISVIIPVYDVEAYLPETIQSVIKQTINFKRNVELILINDGSPDDSGDICEEYARKYPNNITYVYQKNAGVSEARNNGLKRATGRYVHFLDSDDIISKNAYRETIDFLEREHEINFATMRLEFFEATLGEHPLNYKFRRGNRVVDINKEPDSLVFHSAATIFRRDKIVSSFNSTIKISEDVRFLTEQLKVNSKYGVIQNATYFYRRRANGLSATTGSQLNTTFYTVTPYEVYEYIFKILPLNTEGAVNHYAQHAVMYDLQWRLRQKNQTVLNHEEELRYKKTIYALIRRIDDNIILSQSNMGISYKLFVLSIKYGVKESIPRKSLEKLRSMAVKNSPSVIIEFIEQNGSHITVEGRIPDASELHTISAKVNAKKIDMDRLDVKRRHIQFLGDLVHDGCVFKLSIPKSEISHKTKITISNGNNLLTLSPRRQSRIPEARFGYVVFKKWLIRNNGKSISFFEYTSMRHSTFELVWICRMLMALRLQFSAKQLRMILKSKLKRKISLKKMVQPFLIPLIDLARNIRDVGIRLLYRLYKTKKPVWIVSDRFLAAGDNGEALFRFIFNQKSVPASVYFAISKKSSDYSRLRKEFGRAVIDDATLKYKMLFLRSSEIISSHADDFVINPFNWRIKSFYDLFSFNFVFLQHGVTRNDMSAWLNRYNKNIKLFITAAHKERQSILDFDYGYTSEKVVLSGFPRFDYLEDKPKNKLILVPTWRQNLAVNVKDSSGGKVYNKDFKDSDYFTFFNEFINSPTVHDFLLKHNLKGELYLHPSFELQIIDFSENDMFSVKKFPYDYKEAFRDGKVMVTDYSSVFFDFTYLGKPVVFSQFDREKIFETHLYDPGYMNDVEDGFGPVEKNIDSVVKSLEKIAENNFKPLAKYQNRINSFFEYHDTNNSERVYKAILTLDQGRD